MVSSWVLTGLRVQALKAPAPQGRGLSRGGGSGAPGSMRSLISDYVVLGIWDFSGLSVCGDVTCVVSVWDLMNFTSNSFYKLDEVTMMSLRTSISLSVKWE